MATIYLAMNGYCFPLFISLGGKSSPETIQLTFSCRTKFFKRWMGLPWVNFSYDISLHFQQMTLETKSERLRTQLCSWVCHGSMFFLWYHADYPLMMAQATSIPSENTHIAGSACDSSLPHSICSLRRLREKNGEVFVLVCYHWSSSPENCSVK